MSPGRELRPQIIADHAARKDRTTGLIFVGGVQIYPFGSLFGVNGVHFGFFFGDDG